MLLLLVGFGVCLGEGGTGVAYSARPQCVSPTLGARRRISPRPGTNLAGMWLFVIGVGDCCLWLVFVLLFMWLFVVYFYVYVFVVDCVKHGN